MVVFLTLLRRIDGGAAAVDPGRIVGTPRRCGAIGISHRSRKTPSASLSRLILCFETAGVRYVRESRFWGDRRGSRLEKPTLPDFAHRRARPMCKTDRRAGSITPPIRAIAAVDAPVYDRDPIQLPDRTT